jgi:hypothetical protein
VKTVGARISEMAARYFATYPSGVKCLATGKEGLTAYCGPPPNTASGTVIERTSGEPRCRTKALVEYPGGELLMRSPAGWCVAGTAALSGPATRWQQLPGTAF